MNDLRKRSFLQNSNDFEMNPNPNHYFSVRKGKKKIENARLNKRMKEKVWTLAFLSKAWDIAQRIPSDITSFMTGKTVLAWDSLA